MHGFATQRILGPVISVTDIEDLLQDGRELRGFEVKGPGDRGDSRFYAQLEQRVERSHGTNFDRLLREAREQSNGFCLGSGPEIAPFDPSEDPTSDTPDSALGSGSGEMARAGLEPATPRFSVVCSTN